MKVYQVSTDDHKRHYRELSIEYLTWAVERINEYLDFEVKPEDVPDYVDDDMKNLGKLLPPNGHLLIAEIDGNVAGMAGMRLLEPHIFEIKRIYARPQFRGNGIGQTLMQMLLDKAQEARVPLVRLDSGPFMTSAHKLYRSFGFEEIEAYEGGEPPDALLSSWHFFELKLE